jgi:hypothetical protein
MGKQYRIGGPRVRYKTLRECRGARRGSPT